MDHRSFAAVWYSLSLQGRCDLIGGREYRRVLWAWLAAKAPPDVEGFILLHANQPPIRREVEGDGEG